jgi:hypothetical protein
MKISPIASPRSATPTTPSAPRSSITMGKNLSSQPRPGLANKPAELVSKLRSMPPPPQTQINATIPLKTQISPAAVPTVPEVGSNAEIPSQSVAPSKELNTQQVALARKEQSLRKAQQEFKAQQEAWKSEQAKYISKQQLESDTLKTLAEAGISYDKLVELQLSNSPPTESQQLQLKIAELEQKLANVDKTFESRDKAAYDQAVNVIRQDAKLLVDSDPAYETIKATDNTEAVVEFIQEKFNKTGQIASVEQAAKAVEQYLIDDSIKMMERLEKVSAIKAKRTVSSQQEQQPEAPAQVSKPAPTITNRSGVGRPLTPVERAILAFRGELK